MAQQFIKPSVDDNVLEPDAMRGSEHYLTQEIRHPFTGETLDRAEVVNLEQNRRDAMQDAIENRSAYQISNPALIGGQSSRMGGDPVSDRTSVNQPIPHAASGVSPQRDTNVTTGFDNTTQGSEVPDTEPNASDTNRT